MGRYLGLRALYAILAVWGAATLVFTYSYILPGDPSRLLLPEGAIDVDTLARLRQSLGLDVPIWHQYLLYLRDLVAGRLGFSFSAQTSVASLLSPAARVSLMVAVVGLLLGAALAAFLWLVLTARLPRWLSALTGCAYGVLGVTALVWTWLAAAGAAAGGRAALWYYSWWPLHGRGIGDDWSDVLRAGCLVGLVAGGLGGFGLWLAARRLGERRAAASTDRGVPPATLRAVLAILLGRRWGIHLLLAALLLYLIILAERVALLGSSVAALYDRSQTNLDYPVVQAAWLACAVLAATGALALSLIALALDPSLAAPRRRKAEGEATGADTPPSSAGTDPATLPEG